jgi:GTP:adenosylcobinamide-phosphate guanylyltransferase
MPNKEEEDYENNKEEEDYENQYYYFYEQYYSRTREDGDRIFDSNDNRNNESTVRKDNLNGLIKDLKVELGFYQTYYNYYLDEQNLSQKFPELSYPNIEYETETYNYDEGGYTDSCNINFTKYFDHNHNEVFIIHDNNKLLELCKEYIDTKKKKTNKDVKIIYTPIIQYVLDLSSQLTSLNSLKKNLISKRNDLMIKDDELKNNVIDLNYKNHHLEENIKNINDKIQDEKTNYNKNSSILNEKTNYYNDYNNSHNVEEISSHSLIYDVLTTTEVDILKSKEWKVIQENNNIMKNIYMHIKNENKIVRNKLKEIKEKEKIFVQDSKYLLDNFQLYQFIYTIFKYNYFVLLIIVIYLIIIKIMPISLKFIIILFVIFLPNVIGLVINYVDYIINNVNNLI